MSILYAVKALKHNTIIFFNYTSERGGIKHNVNISCSFYSGVTLYNDKTLQQSWVTFECQ